MVTSVLFMQSQTYFGADSVIHGLIMRELDRSKYDVHVAVNRGTRFDGSRSRRAVEDIPGVHVRPTRFGTSINFRTWGQKIRDTLFYGPQSLVSLVGLGIYARKHRVRIVHCTEKPRDAFFGFLLARAVGAKCVVHIHVGVNHDWMSGLTTFAMRHADGLIGVSEYVRQTAIESGYDPAKVHTVLNALDAVPWDPALDGTPVRKELGIGDDEVVMTTISRLCNWKGQTELLDALAEVRATDANFRLLIVGEDDIRATIGNVSYTAQLKEQVASLDLGARVVFTGFRSDTPEILAATDMYTMPSFEEPFGVVFLESAAMEVPIVALNNGGTPEAVQPGAGLLSSPGDQEALVANLLRLMGDEALRAEMGRAGRHLVLTEYTPQRLAADVEAIYAELLGTSAP